jgi:NAD(P)-dependent dehydrogenase (short-subunit alcohol dehydrogenase family)
LLLLLELQQLQSPLHNNSYRRSKQHKYTIHHPTPCKGKVVVITGGSSGLGLESAKRLAAAGAIIVLTSRTEMKGRKAVKEVTKYLIQKGRLPLPSTSTNNDDNVYSLVLNLDDLSDVQEFASR